MRHFFSALALVAVGLLGACGEPLVELSLQLKPADGVDTSNATSLTITLESDAQRDRVLIALDRSQQVSLPSSIERALPFTIDVWACESDACGKADVAFRGCTDDPVDVSQSTGPVPLTISLKELDDPSLSSCPPL